MGSTIPQQNSTKATESQWPFVFCNMVVIVKWKMPLDLTNEVPKFERDLTCQALAQRTGRIVYAAEVLGFS